MADSIKELFDRIAATAIDFLLQYCWEILYSRPRDDPKVTQLHLNHIIRPCRVVCRHSNRMSAHLFASILTIEPVPDLYINDFEVLVFLFSLLQIELSKVVIFWRHYRIYCLLRQLFKLLSQINFPRMVSKDESALVFDLQSVFIVFV